MVEAPGILFVFGIGKIGDGSYPVAGLQRDRTMGFHIDIGDKFPCPQVVQRVVAVVLRNFECFADAGAAPGEAKHNTGSLPRTPVDPRINAGRAVNTKNLRPLHILKVKPRIPHQGTVAKNPKVILFVSV